MVHRECMFVGFLIQYRSPWNCVHRRVWRSQYNVEDMFRIHLNMCLYGVLVFDLNVTAHQSNIGV